MFCKPSLFSHIILYTRWSNDVKELYSVNVLQNVRRVSLIDR